MIDKFPGHLQEIQELVKCELTSREHAANEGARIKGTLFMKTDKVQAKSYGIGTSVFLRFPLQLGHHIVLSAVTTMRDGQGLRSEVGYLFSAIKGINRIVKDEKIETLTLPLFGTGHGDVALEMGLLTFLLALSSVLREGGAHPGLVTIVVFRADADAKPRLSMRAARRMLNLVCSLHPK
jgi:hypothetical protein